MQNCEAANRPAPLPLAAANRGAASSRERVVPGIGKKLVYSLAVLLY
jgi:hypothetical protein